MFKIILAAIIFVGSLTAGVVTSSFTLGAPGQFSQLLGSASAVAGTPGSFDQANVDLVESLQTGGPLRTGVVEWSTSIGILEGGGSDFASGASQVGPVGLSCGNPGCALLVRDDPFQLGQPFVASLTLMASATNLFGLGDASASGMLQFRFFEVDGITPVSVTLTPEPATFAPVLSLLLAMLIYRLGRQLT